MISAREYRYKITIQQQTTTQVYGEVQNNWTTFAIVWAKIQPLTGREYFSAKQIVDEQMLRMTIRYIDNVTTKMQVSYDSNTYDIRDVINVNNANRELQLMCRLAA